MNFTGKIDYIAITVLIYSLLRIVQGNPDVLLDFLKGQEYEATPLPIPKDGQAVLLGQLLRKFLEDNFRQVYYELYLMNRTLSNISASLSRNNLENINLVSNLTEKVSNATLDIALVKDRIPDIKEIKSLNNFTSNIKKLKASVMKDLKKKSQKLLRLTRTTYSIAVRVAEMYQTSVSRRSCADLMKLGESESGVHSIIISPQKSTESIEVYCDMETDGGGWTNIQRRGFDKALSKVNKTYFNRNWTSYQQGFGNATGDYWLGLENIRSLTRNCGHELLINLTDSEGQNRFAHYDIFKIGSKLESYRLYVQGYSGNVDDSFLYHHKRKFSTFDEDNDDNRNPTNSSCAKMYGGGWWFGDCLKSNLNGNYPGIRWNSWTGMTGRMKHSIKMTEMKIRPTSNC